MPYSYYIYYRVNPAHMETAGTQIQQLLDTIKNTTGIPGRLMKKRGEPELWMEVYENVADAAKFECELAQAVNELEATEFLPPGTGRHIECFET